MKIALVTPARRFIANRSGLGYQIPLGLVFVGGPLLDAGHEVRLFDNDVLGLSEGALAEEISKDPPECVMIGHTGSTAAHPIAMQTAKAIKERLPRATIVYGGVYPSYTARTILQKHPEVDVIVRGEGEETALSLVAALARDNTDLGSVRGITWRKGLSGEVIHNRDREPLQNLDQFRPGWELVDWEAYQLFGFGRSAGMQLSRGCPLRCTYCGQWGFWRRWRHRSADNFVGELEVLARRYGVKAVWMADENFSADQELAKTVFEKLIERGLGLSLNLNLTAADAVRDAEILPLYKKAGVDNVVMGVESLDDEVVEEVRKNNPYSISEEAVRLMRQNDIVSLVNIIYGLEEESLSSIWRTFRQLLSLDPDVVNAVYLTPHSWTPAGRHASAAQVIQPDLSLFTYRNQVMHTPKLAPWQLFSLVKLSEVFFHLRPRAISRLFFSRDPRFRQVLRSYFSVGAKVAISEVVEFFRARFVAPGDLAHIPGYPEGSTQSIEV